MDYKRITSYYMRRFAIIDIVSVFIIIICPASGSYSLNFAKLWLILKVGRLFQIDDFYLRKLNIHRKSKAIYVIFKLMVIIFLLSHMVGLIFYAMDNYLCSSGIYESQCIYFFYFQFVGSMLRLHIPPLIPYRILCNICIHYIGA